jgi:GDP-mannose 6-dehydrogenase
VIVRSTVLPGTTESLIIPLLEARSGRQLGRDLSVSVMPEFLREGSAVTDFSHPARIIIGAQDERGYATALAVSCVETAPVFRVSTGVAELVKYVDNAWHALKVAFANEIGTIAQEHHLDGQEVMELFCRDDKLNLAPSYLRPGAPFGGSCLPKDVRALTRRAQEKKLDVPLLDAVLASNDRHLDRIFDSVVGYGSRRVGVLGLAFKEKTDDLRESPMVTLVRRLLNMGFDVRVHEPHLSAASATRGPGEQLYGLPLDRPEFLTESVDDLIGRAQTLIIGTGWTMTDGLAQRLRSTGLTVVNMAGPQRPR